MSTLVAAAVQKDADRPLTSRSLKASLVRLRPVNYEQLRYYLEWITTHVRILELWRNVFPDVDLPAKTSDTWTLQCEFAGKVWRERFPADLDYMDSQVNCGEDPFNWPIIIQGVGVPWEVTDIQEMHPLDILMVSYFMPILSNDYIEDREGWLEGLSAWEEANDVLRPRFLCRSDDVGLRELKAKIRQAPAPLCFLADLVDAVRKNTGNMFMDMPNAWMQFEYMETEYVYYWVSDDVIELSEIFAPVAAAHRGILSLYEWWEIKGTKKAIAEISDVLRPLLSTPYDPNGGTT